LSCEIYGLIIDWFLVLNLILVSIIEVNENHHRNNGNPKGEALFCRILLVIYQQNKLPPRLIAQASKTVKTNS